MSLTDAKPTFLARHVAEARGVDIKVDSAGTAGYHSGEEPDDRRAKYCSYHLKLDL